MFGRARLGTVRKDFTLGSLGAWVDGEIGALSASQLEKYVVLMRRHRQNAFALWSGRNEVPMFGSSEM